VFCHIDVTQNIIPPEHKLLMEVPSVDIVKQMLDRIRMEYGQAGKLVPCDITKQIKPAGSMISPKPIQSVGKVRKYSKRGEVCGYEYYHNHKSKSFSIKKYGSLDLAKQAAETYRLEMSN
jgi:hypothetical protein